MKKTVGTLDVGALGAITPQPSGGSPDLLFALPDNYSVAAGHTLTVTSAFGLLANDLTTQGALEAQNFSSPAHGSLQLVTDGSFVYVPDSGFVGVDTFSYTAGNGSITAAGTVTIDVHDNPPVGNADSYVVKAGTTLSIAAAQGILANDYDPNDDSIEAINFQPTTNGTLNLVTDGSFTYVPNPGFVGSESFTYTVSDGVLSNTATATITVVDRPPIANDDFYAGPENGTLTISAAKGLLANDFDPDGDVLQTQNFFPTTHGTLHLVTDGSFSYTPDQDFVGNDTFTYTVSDGALTATATGTIEVGTPIVPVANPDFYNFIEGGSLTISAASGLLTNDVAPQGATIEVTNFTPPTSGTLNLVTDGSFTYTPNPGLIGDDSFTYTISDGAKTASSTATIKVVAPTVLAGDDIYHVHENRTLQIAAAQGLLANDYASSGALEAINFSPPAYGTLNLVTDGSFTYVPKPGFIGTDTAAYTVSNGVVTASGTVTFEVFSHAPVAMADDYAMFPNGTLSVNAEHGLLANDYDPNGDPIEATNFSPPAYGTLNLVTDGSFTYVPKPGFIGADTFSYTIGDGDRTAQATDTIEVACFRQGTHIATSRGDIAVEDLRIGDRATLARGPGSHAGVRWIGRRSIDCAGHPRPHDVWPVRVAAHGFGAGLPARDLWLSPDHAVFIDGVLIPVRCLLNDATVVQKHTSCITYFHVELPCHDMLLAEGLPCESYLDVGNRAAFENGGVVMQAHPDFASATWEACGCAPLVVSGPKLEAARLLVNKYAVDVMARRRAAGGRAA